MKTGRPTLLCLVSLPPSFQTQLFPQPRVSAVPAMLHDVAQAPQNLSQNSLVACLQMLLQFSTTVLENCSLFDIYCHRRNQLFNYYTWVKNNCCYCQCLLITLNNNNNNNNNNFGSEQKDWRHSANSNWVFPQATSVQVCQFLWCQLLKSIIPTTPAGCRHTWGMRGGDTLSTPLS